MLEVYENPRTLTMLDLMEVRQQNSFMKLKVAMPPPLPLKIYSENFKLIFKHRLVTHFQVNKLLFKAFRKLL